MLHSPDLFQYTLSVFWLPQSVINDIDFIRRNFLWNGADPTIKKIHLINWVIACKPKYKGGLGVINLRVMNQSLLSKWIWR
jgi:hypothetical protein